MSTACLFPAIHTWRLQQLASVPLSTYRLIDEQPVIYPNRVEANTAPSLYDVLGRRYFLRAK